MASETTRDARRLASRVRAAISAPISQQQALLIGAQEAIWAACAQGVTTATIRVMASYRTRQPADWEWLLCTEVAGAFEVGVDFVPGRWSPPARGAVIFTGAAARADVAAATFVSLRQQLLRDLMSEDRRSVSSVSASWRLQWVHRLADQLQYLRRPKRNAPAQGNEHRHVAGNRG